jgi:hypothetical protein
MDRSPLPHLPFAKRAEEEKKREKFCCLMAWGQFSLTAKPQRVSSLDYRAAKEVKLDSRDTLEELTQRKEG